MKACTWNELAELCKHYIERENSGDSLVCFSSDGDGKEYSLCLEEYWETTENHRKYIAENENATLFCLNP